MTWNVNGIRSITARQGSLSKLLESCGAGQFQHKVSLPVPYPGCFWCAWKCLEPGYQPGSIGRSQL